MLVREVLEKKGREVIAVRPATRLVEAMRILIDHKISCLVILDEAQQLVGIVSDKDIFKAIYHGLDDFQKHTVGELMTTELIVGLSEDDINYISGLMTENRIRHVPIVEREKLVGLISIGDVVKSQMKDMEIENRYLKAYIDGNYPG